MSDWYIATLIIQAVVDDPRAEEDILCDEQIRLIRADDPHQAYRKALALGNGEEVEYKNEFGGTVRWQFVGLRTFNRLDADEMTDGGELRCLLFHHPNPTSLVYPRDQLDAFLGPPDTE